jgi:hypothetical protein
MTLIRAAASGRLVGPHRARSIPLDLEGAGGQRFFPGSCRKPLPRVLWESLWPLNENDRL